MKLTLTVFTALLLGLLGGALRAEPPARPVVDLVPSLHPSAVKPLAAGSVRIVGAVAAASSSPIHVRVTSSRGATHLAEVESKDGHFECRYPQAFAGAPTPVTTEGAPPAVDVYIDDGRHGEYPFQPVWWENQSIWNRLKPDGLTTHQTPVVGKVNYAYVKVKNRGTQTAKKVIVKAFHADPAAGLVYPNDWQAMTTAQIAVPNIAANNSTGVIVGPFKWTPAHVGHECVFMIASAIGDKSNVSNLSAGESIPEWRLVPHDNNIGQRNLSPVPFISLTKFAGAFERLGFTLKTPLQHAAKTILDAVLPKLLVERGWKLEFTNPGAGALKLRAGETKEITMRLVPGKDFTAAELAKTKDPSIRIEAYADGILVGGMTYPIAPAKG